MTFTTPYTFNPLLDRGEVNKGESMTIPDQSLTIRQILERFTLGQPVMGSHAVMYDGENPSHDDIDPTLDPAFDLSDYTTISSEIVTAKAERKAKAQAAKAEAERSEAEAKAAKAEAEAKAEADSKA